MAKRFAPPALQHLARSLRDTPEEVAKALVQSYLSRPPFRYQFLDDLIRVALKGGSFTCQQFDEAVKKRQPVERFQRILLELTPLIHEHFGSLRPRFILDVPPQIYRINRLEIPFRPPFAFESNGEIVIPWFLFWRSNPLTANQGALLTTLIKELLDQEPDYSDAKLVLYDFSAPDKSSARQLVITDARLINKVETAERDASLDVFYKGYEMAEAQIELLTGQPRKSSHAVHERQGLLWDELGE